MGEEWKGVKRYCFQGKSRSDSFGRQLQERERGGERDVTLMFLFVCLFYITKPTSREHSLVEKTTVV